MTALSPSQTDELREQLRSARRDLVGHIRPRLEGADDPAAVSLRAHLGQPDDMSQAMEIGDNEMALLGQEQAQLRDLDSALARLEQGAANVCSVCGQDIPFERLQALPTAHTCVRCQARNEQADHVPPAPTM